MHRVSIFEKENGGFWFKETVMTWDPLRKEGDLRKVLGLRWDTEEAEICVDVVLNYGEKVKGANTEEDAPLADPASALPCLVTRKMLWRVAQGQYDPLGLLSVYMVKWKLLMRKVTLKGKSGEWESALDREEEEFRGLLWDLNELRKIRFPRCVRPLEGQFKRPLKRGLQRRVARSLLLSGVPEVGAGRQLGMLQVGDRKDAGSPQSKNNYSKNGTRGRGQLGEAGQEGQGDTEDPSGRDSDTSRTRQQS
jgi:hypothetical protein